jgi:hypothetical protein
MYWVLDGQVPVSTVSHIVYGIQCTNVKNCFPPEPFEDMLAGKANALDAEDSMKGMDFVTECGIIGYKLSPQRSIDKAHLLVQANVSFPCL